jgi:hypothetical protein
VVRLPTQPEILAIEEAHRAAQARLGVASAYLAIRDWTGVSATAAVSTGDAWLSRSLQMIRAINRKSMRLAKAYYQVARALETGYSLGVPESSPDPKAVTMGGLRKQYLDLLLEVADLGKPQTTSTVVHEDPDERWLEEELIQAQAEPASEPTDESVPITLADTDLDSYIQDMLDAADDSEHPDAEKVGVDEYDWEEPELTLADIRELFSDELKSAADERAEKIRKIRENDALTAKEAFKQADKLHKAAGVINAGRVDQAGIDAGRDLINLAASRDKRVMMWARGTGPNPCAFCSMLASRGFAYTSKARAMTTKGGGDQTSAFGGASVKSFHPNCHCFPVLRWADIPDATAPGRNAHYEELWKSKMKGKSIASRGTKNDTLNYWRRIIAAERRATRDAHRKAYHAESIALAKARSTA